jgi:4-amino-4-deoxy-L-arabinose transferase-like glycosyltransferase
MTSTRRATSLAYTVLIGLAAVTILLQGLWAGLFLRPHGDSGNDWLDVHARGGEVALALSAIAALVAFMRMRHRRDLWLGAGALTGLLVLEAYIGGLIKDDGKDSLTPVHVPLALAIMGLAAWLFARSRRARRPTATQAAAYPRDSAVAEVHEDSAKVV